MTSSSYNAVSYILEMPSQADSVPLLFSRLLLWRLGLRRLRPALAPCFGLGSKALVHLKRDQGPTGNHGIFGTHSCENAELLRAYIEEVDTLIRAD